jgi:protein-S-isoprenylcysteine O-methyltransferase Ste14
MNLEFSFRALTTVWGVGEILLAVFTQTRQGEGKIQDRGTQIVLWVVIIGSFKIEEWMHGFLPVDMPGSYSWLRPAALGILILGLGVRIVAIVTLGGAFSTNVATRAGQSLQRSGLNGLVRHPSYLGLELILLAFALHAHTHGPVLPLSWFHRLWLCCIAFILKGLRSAWLTEPTMKAIAGAQSG